MQGSREGIARPAQAQRGKGGETLGPRRGGTPSLSKDMTDSQQFGSPKVQAPTNVIFAAASTNVTLLLHATILWLGVARQQMRRLSHPLRSEAPRASRKDNRFVAVGEDPPMNMGVNRPGEDLRSICQ